MVATPYWVLVRTSMRQKLVRGTLQQSKRDTKLTLVAIKHDGLSTVSGLDGYCLVRCTHAAFSLARLFDCEGRKRRKRSITRGRLIKAGTMHGETLTMSEAQKTASVLLVAEEASVEMEKRKRREAP